MKNDPLLDSYSMGFSIATKKVRKEENLKNCEIKPKILKTQNFEKVDFTKLPDT